MGKIPFSHAGILRFEGQLMTVIPGKSMCYRCFFKEPPKKGVVPSCSEAGVIGAIAGVIGSLQALEAIKYLTNTGELLTGKILTFNALTMKFRTVKLPKRGEGCEVCSDHPTIIELIDYEQPACQLNFGGEANE